MTPPGKTCPFAPDQGPVTRREVLVLVGLLAMCLALRVVHAWRAELIAVDGITYLDMARTWSRDPGLVVTDYDYPPGYPVAVNVLHGLLRAGGLPDGREGWELAGRCVSIIASLAAMVAIWLWVRRGLGRTMAAMSVLLFGVARKWAILNSDVTSDTLAICLELWAIVLLVWTMPTLRAVCWRGMLGAAGAGLLVGLAYLVRPEALWVLAVAGIVLAWQSAVRRIRLLPAAAFLVVMTIAAAGPAVPYMAAIGGLSNKTSFKTILSRSDSPTPDRASLPPRAAPLGVAAIGPAELAGQGHWIAELWAAASNAGRQYIEAMHPVIGFASLAWMAAMALRLTPRRWRLRRLPPVPYLWPTRVAVACAVVVLPAAIVLHLAVGYASHRHILFLAALLCPLAPAAVIFAARLAGHLAGPARRRRTALRVGWGLTLLMFVGMLGHNVAHAHKGKAYLRLTGESIHQLARPGDYLLTNDPWVAYYAQMPARYHNFVGIGLDLFTKATRDASPPVTLVCYDPEGMGKAAALAATLDPNHPVKFRPIKEFSARGKTRLILGRVER